VKPSWGGDSVSGSQGRSSLGFQEAVGSSFRFLESEHGYECLERSLTIVRYESPTARFHVFHGRSSFQIDVELSEKTVPEPESQAFRLADLAALIGAEEQIPLGFFQASTPEAVQIVVMRTAELVRRCGPETLRAEPFIIRRLDELRRERARQAAQLQRLADIRVAVDRAWHQKDYRRVEELFASVEEMLSPAELKKLRYVRTQISH
jgi:hypothetical protein